MARTPEFDRDAAVDAAMKLFWSQGFTATALPQLLKAMAIGRGSFYAAFGSKEALFSECLERFAERTLAIIVDARESGEPLAAIHQFFRHTLFEVPRHRVTRGCMMVNTILELAENAPALADAAVAGLDRIEAEFAACFADAQGAGSYPATRSPAELASVVMLINQGLRVASRKNEAPESLNAALTSAMSMLDLAA